MAIDIGLIAYNMFVQTMNGVSEDNRGYAEWHHLSKREQDAWRHAAVAVSKYLTKERERLETDLDICD